ncbi:MAG: acyl dehydratase [Betaproteobacteria bacterium]|jgi:acyl dehydratase|nr:acyl dehydratase [Betaproteobacteria bacterium]
MTSPKTTGQSMQFEDIRVGQALPPLDIPVTVTLIAGGAIATRDYFPGHHDADAARALGSPDVFMNILTTNALVQRFVEQWSGPDARFKSVKIKLGAPNYPGDTLRLRGEVMVVDPVARSAELRVSGKNGLGDHVSATVTLALP